MWKGALVVLFMISAAGKVDPVTRMASCAPSCYEQRWWIGVSSSCDVLCMAQPSLDECMHADCKAVSAPRYDSGVLRTFSPMLFSDENRSFYLLGSLMNSYAIVPECRLQIDMRPPSSFSCTGDSMVFTVGQYLAATMSQSAALDAAAAAATPGRYSW